ncbi:MAG TPA: hypothetical protein VFG83_13900 [Kofleriaceae bacterium]|nr:hypothetical protein [Kofleriaceae bacterium]
MANDHYEVWLAEKIWELIPAYYRHEDGLGENPGVLRGLVDVMATQGAILRRSQDRLWEDQSIETADDWAVPYIADLVATRLVSALNSRGRRVDVAKTIYYRRRSGTIRVLEELASDICGWESKVVEEFRRLARAHHGLDPAPGALAGRFRGRFSGSPPGGTADLRRAVSAEGTGGPFDEFHYTPDFRRPAGRLGRRGISKLGFHLFRLKSFRIEHVTPGTAVIASGPTIHTFDPSGRDVALFNPAARSERWDDWQSALEWELPTPMRCRILGHAEYAITDEVIAALRSDTGLSAAQAATLFPIRNTVFPDESSLLAVLMALPNAAQFDPVTHPARYRVLLREALRPDTGKYFLAPAYVAVELSGTVPVPRESSVAGSLADPAAPPSAPARSLIIDPVRGRFLHTGPAVRSVTFHYGFAGPIGAAPVFRGLLPAADRTYSFDATGSRVLLNNPADDNGVITVADNATYTTIRNRLSVGTLTVQASDGKRPFLQLGRNWRLRGRVAGDAVLMLDGLWVGSRGDFDVRLERDYEAVTLRSCTFDPGGLDAAGNPLFPVEVVVRGHIETLVIDRCILASLRVGGGGMVERLELRDSIVTGPGGGAPAIQLPRTEVHLERVTVAGELECHRLHASEALLTAHATVVDTQNGCVRFSAYREASRLPHPYESHAFADFHAFFESRRFGDASFFKLGAAAPGAVLNGAENGSEIGAWSSLINPTKAEGLAAKVSEFLPFGLIPAQIAET